MPLRMEVTCFRYKIFPRPYSPTWNYYTYTTTLQPFDSNLSIGREFPPICPGTPPPLISPILSGETLRLAISSVELLIRAGNNMILQDAELRRPEVFLCLFGGMAEQEEKIAAAKVHPM